MGLRVCLLNDSFPPVIDGVANATFNYANIIEHQLGKVIVATPKYPNTEDHYDFPVVRYRSVNTTKIIGYRAGYPFSVRALQQLRDFRPEIIHTHCPVMSTAVGRVLREELDIPMIFTYHTKFKLEIEHAVDNRLVTSAAIRFLVKNMESCDEVWVVSRGAGEDMRSLGYEGEYHVMPNGVDFPRGAVSPEEREAILAEHNIPKDVPVFLFVGRMMWYKGVQIIFDALRLAKQNDYPFRLLMVGDGGELTEMKEKVFEMGLSEECIFTGAIRDREKLRAYFSAADLFLFPSTYDTNGIVVREAAACGLGSMLIRGSCAAEDITDGQNGILIEENGESMWAAIKLLTREKMAEIGQNAQNDIYVSWEESVRSAYDRYQVVLDRYRCGHTERHFEWSDEFMGMMSSLCKNISFARSVGAKGRERLSRLKGLLERKNREEP